MVCTGYDPRFQKQLDGSTYAGLNCTCASAAMSVDDDTCGKVIVHPPTVRYWTGDKVGGTNLSEVDDALNAHTPTRLDVRYNYPYATFAARVKKGEGAILQGGYAPIADSPFDAGNGFRGNHAIYVPPDFKAMDPLADGRFPGVYRFHGEVYPEDLLMRFAGHLNLEPRPGQPANLLGNGLVYAAFTRDNDTAWHATVRPAGTKFMRYFVAITKYGQQIRGRELRTTKAGFQLSCTPPRLVWENAGSAAPTVRRSIVEVAGPSPNYDNFWIDSKWAEEI